LKQSLDRVGQHMLNGWPESQPKLVNYS